MMGISENLYDILLSPLESLRLSKKRHKLIGPVKGNILEVGVGTGVNFKYYHYNRIKKLDLIDISLTDKVASYKFPKELDVTLNELSVENLPFEDNSYDYVIFTLVFCSVPNPELGLKEIKRVLKPNGKIIFMEHVLPHHQGLRKLFHKLTPTWKQLAHGCHLNRETLKTISEHGFIINESERYFKGTFVSGTATNQN